jgi:hypothetical protein
MFSGGGTGDGSHLLSFSLPFSSGQLSVGCSCTVNIPNKCKELLPTKLQFKVDKNPTWFRSWMLLDDLFHCKEGSAGPSLKNVMNGSKFQWVSFNP